MHRETLLWITARFFATSSLLQTKRILFAIKGGSLQNSWKHTITFSCTFRQNTCFVCLSSQHPSELGTTAKTVRLPPTSGSTTNQTCTTIESKTTHSSCIPYIVMVVILSIIVTICLLVSFYLCWKLRSTLNSSSQKLLSVSTPSIISHQGMTVATETGEIKPEAIFVNSFTYKCN